MSKRPLFVITGASGTGKTTVSSHVRKLLPEFDVFDMDIIDNVDWQIAKENWSRVAYSISLSGRGTILCGTMVPENIASSKYIDQFDQVHYVNLHCDDHVREARLQARGWNEDAIEDHRNFANWSAAKMRVPPLIRPCRQSIQRICLPKRRQNKSSGGLDRTGSELYVGNL